jgi:hypothetical protein
VIITQSLQQPTQRTQDFQATLCQLNALLRAEANVNSQVHSNSGLMLLLGVGCGWWFVEHTVKTECDKMHQLPLSSLRNWKSLETLNHLEHLNHESREGRKKYRAQREETCRQQPTINKMLGCFGFTTKNPAFFQSLVLLFYELMLKVSKS